MSTPVPAVCPLCGQNLVNREAVERLRRNQASQLRELQAQIAEEASALAEKNVAAQRARLEKDAATAQNKRVKTLENALKQVQHENAQLERRIEKLNAHERGEFHEVDVHDQLLHAFPGDKVERRGKGADIVHTVYYQTGRTSQRAGVIAYECKDTIRWEKGFIKQMQKAGVAQGTPYLILVTRASPPGEKGFCMKDNVIIVQPDYVLAIAHLVRKWVIELHRAGHRTDGRDEKTTRLFEYLTGDEFHQAFRLILGASDSLRLLLADEKRAHERVWMRREQAYDELGRKSSVVDEAIRTIIDESPRTDAKVIPLPSRAKAS